MEVGCAFEFVVSEPEKKDKGGKLDLAFWVYHIHTKTTLEQYPNKSLTVTRRFNDFQWLRDQLVEDNPGIIVPPIPEKEIKGALEKLVNIPANNLLEFRQRALKKFLVRTGAHPILFSSKLFQEFLEYTDDAWARRMKVVKPKSASAPAPEQGFFKRFGFSRGGGNNDGASGGGGAQGGGSGGGGATTQGYTKAIEQGTLTTPSMWSDTMSYVSQLETSLMMLKDRIEALVRRRRDTANVLKEFGKAFAKVGEVETEFEASPLSQALVDVGHHSEHLALIYVEQSEQELVQVAETLGYYIGMCTAVKEVVRGVQGILSEHERTTASVQDSVANRDKMIAKGAPADKRAKAEADIAALSTRRDELADSVEKTQALFREELRRFHREKAYDIKYMLRSFVELQLEYSTKMKKSWECLLPQIEQVKL